MQVIHGEIKRPATSVDIVVGFGAGNEVRDWVVSNINPTHAWSRWATTWLTDGNSDGESWRYTFRYEKDAAFFALRWK